jgi:heat shock protein HslJ
MSASRRRVAVLVGSLAAVLLATAVALATGTGSGSTANDAGWLDSLGDVQGRWVSIAGHADDGTTPWTAPVVLTVDGDVITMRGRCNTLAARVDIRDHRLHATGGVTGTAMGCPPEEAARDAWLAALIEDHATIQLQGSTQGPMLTLDTDAGWVGFIRTGAGPLPTVTDPDQPVSSTPSP